MCVGEGGDLCVHARVRACVRVPFLKKEKKKCMCVPVCVFMVSGTGKWKQITLTRLLVEM